MVLNPEAPSYIPIYSVRRNEISPVLHQPPVAQYRAAPFPLPQFPTYFPNIVAIPNHYQLLPVPPPPTQPTGNFLTPPPEAADAPVDDPPKQVWFPRVVLTERNFGSKRRRIKGFVRRARGRGNGNGNGNGGFEIRERDTRFGENKDGGRRAYASKYQSVALEKKENDTTVMIKNIPYHFTPTMLVGFMDDFCKMENERDGHFSSAYDFLYLPMDFQSHLNKGYAFVNFSHPQTAWNFFSAYNQTKWDSTSPKIRKIVRARIQGKGALVSHFQRSFFECETPEFLPRSFDPPRDGSGGKVRVTVVGTRRASRYSN